MRIGSTVAALALAAAASLGVSDDARAFCGFYVSGADAKMFNNATMVVLMRDGTRTVLSMQNNYQGPPQDFALVVPVPIILQKENVKTLPRAVFDRIDQLAAPRLVEYWEQDPCPPEREEYDMEAKAAYAPSAPGGAPAPAQSYGVKVEAQFTVGEYEIVILSAKDALGLDAWLRDNKYKIPEGAAEVLRPYVASGMKFFVAKVDTKKVKFENGMATLSPLRFHYDTDTFMLPVRLGLLNSAGTQDLIVHILARGTRYEVANFPNTTIPTNLDVAEAARDQFGAFYASLFDRTVQSRPPGTVVTEYSWDAMSCDPCPSPPLEPSELATLGEDVLNTAQVAGPAGPPAMIPGMPMPGPVPSVAGPPGAPGPSVAGPPGAPPAPPPMPMPMPPPMWGGGGQGFVLTRLHARYTKGSLGDDLVFKAAPPIEGGRENPGPNGRLEEGARRGSMNNFQGRYAIRHPWTGPITCSNPHRGVWGGPPEGVQGSTQPKAVQNVAFARRDMPLPAFLAQDVPEIGVRASGSAPEGWNAPQSSGCGGCRIDAGEPRLGLAAAALAATLALLRRKTKRS